ncbi:hypothetical protein HN018_14570 [Lichenicola cladoniae]|uniref:Uncharacterized protein n=1 Tax=Lichenicola cladoniae TaxID=1484109 RepID=A0A6M8HS64_9PROT|nr:hypothetical protein [Lichenicola cladoniae]NPD65898.1 hypothetical protein [Acetobacteraceae bacterium]QKE91106.1 hypothetical protein HN018_14570 [Lichenicola cladoniae]
MTLFGDRAAETKSIIILHRSNSRTIRPRWQLLLLYVTHFAFVAPNVGFGCRVSRMPL